MKLILILILNLLMVHGTVKFGFSTNNELGCTKETDCPETKESDIIILTAVLGHSDLLNEMRDLGLNIDVTVINGDELREKDDIPGFLRSYWKDQGVEV